MKNYTKENALTKVFGNKKFLKSFFRLFIPSALQSIVTILVLYVDNFALATLVEDKVLANAAKEALGLANPIVNFQLLFVCAWLNGIGVMLSQYYGDKDSGSVRNSVCMRLWSGTLVQLPIILIISFIPGELITLSSGISSGSSFELARIYLFFATFTFIPMSLAMSLSFTLKETKRAGIAFIGACIGVTTNIVLDPIVIILSNDIETAVMFVAISTGLSRVVQFIFILIYILCKKDDYLWFFNSWKMPISKLFKILKYSMPVFINEAIYSICNMMLMICMLRFNTSAHDATTNLMLIVQFTTCVWPGMASAASVLIGSELGSGRIDEAKHNSGKLLVWGAIMSTFLGLVLFILAIFINPILSPAASNEMNELSRNLEWMMTPILITQGISAIAYYAAKSGGSKIVILIDGGVMLLWAVILVPITVCGLTKNMDPLLYVFILESNQIARMILGLIVLKYCKWANTLTNAKFNIMQNEVEHV